MSLWHGSKPISTCICKGSKGKFASVLVESIPLHNGLPKNISKLGHRYKFKRKTIDLDRKELYCFASFFLDFAVLMGFMNS